MRLRRIDDTHYVTDDGLYVVRRSDVDSLWYAALASDDGIFVRRCVSQSLRESAAALAKALGEQRASA